MRVGSQNRRMRRAAIKSCEVSSSEETFVKPVSDFDSDFLETENLFEILNRKVRLSPIDWDYIIDCAQFREESQENNGHGIKALEEMIPESDSDSSSGSSHSSSSFGEVNIPKDKISPKDHCQAIGEILPIKQKVVNLVEEYLSDTDSSVSESSSKPSILEQYVEDVLHQLPIAEESEVGKLSHLALPYTPNSKQNVKQSTAHDLDTIWISKDLSQRKEEHQAHPSKVPDIQISQSPVSPVHQAESTPGNLRSGAALPVRSRQYGIMTRESLFSKHLLSRGNLMQSGECTWYSQASGTINKLQTRKECSQLGKPHLRKHKVSFEGEYALHQGLANNIDIQDADKQAN